ncbi:MAG: TauD/TfdA family dioxygenase [Pseudomonadales bacterium]|nr:TauD/TfdA family dioxygenase [Pseudomonadales bacterium]
MSYRFIDVDPSIGPVGALISGVDLAGQLTEDIVGEIHSAWLKHRVLFFRDQKLNPAKQAAFASQFGELDVYPFVKAVDAHPNVIPIIKEPDAKMNFGGAWHTDTSYSLQPPKATLLQAIEVPDVGGDTLFADASLAYQELSDGMKQMLEGLTGVYSAKMVHGGKGAYTSVAGGGNIGDAYSEDKETAAVEVEHPLIRTHDETGAKSIYCNKFHTHRIKGWTREESLPIFDFLVKHLIQSRFVSRFKWQVDSLAMWDNRCVFHNPMNDYQGKRRHMHRVIVQGAIPI